MGKHWSYTHDESRSSERRGHLCERLSQPLLEFHFKWNVCYTGNISVAQRQLQSKTVESIPFFKLHWFLNTLTQTKTEAAKYMNDEEQS